MKRMILFLAALLGSTSAAAQTSPPPIAFVKPAVRGDAIYLVRPNGADLTKIYQGRSSSRSGTPIESIALRLRPGGGGEVAFVEGQFTLRVQRHDDLGRPQGNAYDVTIAGSAGCALHDLDYLSNGTLVVADSCMNVWTVAPGEESAARTPLFQAEVNSLTALGTDILYVDGSILKRRTDAGAISALRNLDLPFFFLDSSATTAFLSEWFPSTFQTVALQDPHVRSDGCTQGGRVEVSPDGTEILYWYRNQLLLHSSDCSGQTPTRVVRGLSVFAWRTY